MKKAVTSEKGVDRSLGPLKTLFSAGVGKEGPLDRFPDRGVGAFPGKKHNGKSAAFFTKHC